MLKSLEHHEHAEHISHGKHGDHGGDHGHGPSHGDEHAESKADKVNPKHTALLVACLAAGLAISEQGAKHAEIKVQENAISMADAWAQYQAKSTRGTVARDVMLLAGILEFGTPEQQAKRDQLMESLKRDQERYERDPNDGREAIAHRAHEFEHKRHYALEQTHAYHNGSAAFEIGIVVATASAIIGSALLLRLAMGLGAAGIILALLGYFAPHLGAL